MTGLVAGSATGYSGCGGATAVDTDGDGVPDEQDAFPNDPTETTDTDGDGVGDNADAFPNDPAETTDTDGDGVGDNSDAFPNDPTESADTDGDGVGDNADAFPNDPTETTDTDGDGVGDNSDAFPNDPTETVDTDGDGVGDNADAFPNDPTETTDADEDAVGANTDCDDDDPNNWVSCADCKDGDADTYFVDCDAYATIDGPDCNDWDEDNWLSCETCEDMDGDLHFVGCDAYVSNLGPDCNDTDPLIHMLAADLPDNAEDENCDSTVLTAADGPGVYVDEVSACPGLGTLQRPYCDLQMAVDNAEPGANIFVAGGAAYDAIEVDQPVNLFGGYQGGQLDCSPGCIYVPGPWSRDIETLPTEITATGSEAAGVAVSDGVGPVTLEGFVINGGAGISENTYGVTTGGPTDQGEVILIRNTIHGGSPSYGFSFGVYVRGPTVIMDCDIDGGDGTRGTTGVQVGGHALVIGNIIDAGDSAATGATTHTRGVMNTGLALVHSNAIYGGDGAHEAAGITNATGYSTVVNNILFGGNPVEVSRGVHIYSGGRVVLGGNTIYAGEGDLTSYGIDARGSNELVAVNNIVLGGTGAQDAVLNMDGAIQPKLVHNDLWGLNTDGLMRYREGSSVQLTSDMAVINGCGWNDCAQAVGNTSVNPAFADFAYHLNPASACVDAGTDPRPYLTESLQSRFAFFLDHDRDGDFRPLDGDGSGTAEWDIGADEVAP